MKNIFCMILLLSICFLSVSAQERDFYIEIIPNKNVLSRGEIFTVKTNIMNVTSKEQKLCFWNCSYDENWQLEDSSDNLHLYGTVCNKNFVSCITLKHLEKFEKELYLQISDSAKKGPAEIKLSFTPCVSREECFETAKENQEAFLSQQVTVNIK